jgi:hypothetical protein
VVGDLFDLMKHEGTKATKYARSLNKDIFYFLEI